MKKKRKKGILLDIHVFCNYQDHFSTSLLYRFYELWWWGLKNIIIYWVYIFILFFFFTKRAWIKRAECKNAKTVVSSASVLYQHIVCSQKNHNLPRFNITHTPVDLKWDRALQCIKLTRQWQSVLISCILVDKISCIKIRSGHFCVI